MGGAETEIGEISAKNGQDIGNLLMFNRELAIEAAHEKADRVVLSFRRAKVFERTFQRELDTMNSLIGFTHVAEGGFVPVGYNDPNAEMPSPTSLE